MLPGRLLYTTGDTEGAVRYFLGLLREAGPRTSTPNGLGLVTEDVSTPDKQTSTDRVYLEDFRVALKVEFPLHPVLGAAL
jgi:trafficking protein particle complex subunit 8